MPSFGTIVLDIEKGVEIAAEDALKILSTAEKTVPAGITGVTILASAVDKALSDAAGDAANPTSLVLTLPSQVSDFKAVWGDAKSLIATIKGVKLG